MKEYGSTVVYVRNGEEINALVAQSSQQADGEHLTLVYLDPAFNSPLLGGSTLQRAMATAFVGPLQDGGVNGWKEVEKVHPYLAPLEARPLTDTEQKTYAEQLVDLTPSASDLDAHAKDEQIAADTAGTGEPTSSPEPDAAKDADDDGKASSAPTPAV